MRILKHTKRVFSTPNHLDKSLVEYDESFEGSSIAQDSKPNWRKSSRSKSPAVQALDSKSKIMAELDKIDDRLLSFNNSNADISKISAVEEFANRKHENIVFKNNNGREEVDSKKKKNRKIKNLEENLIIDKLKEEEFIRNLLEDEDETLRFIAELTPNAKKNVHETPSHPHHIFSSMKTPKTQNKDTYRKVGSVNMKIGENDEDSPPSVSENRELFKDSLQEENQSKKKEEADLYDYVIHPKTAKKARITGKLRDSSNANNLVDDDIEDPDNQLGDIIEEQSQYIPTFSVTSDNKKGDVKNRASSKKSAKKIVGKKAVEEDNTQGRELSRNSSRMSKQKQELVQIRDAKSRESRIQENKQRDAKIQEARKRQDKILEDRLTKASNREMRIHEASLKKAEDKNSLIKNPSRTGSKSRESKNRDSGNYIPTKIDLKSPLSKKSKINKTVKKPINSESIVKTTRSKSPLIADTMRQKTEGNQLDSDANRINAIKKKKQQIWKDDLDNDGYKCGIGMLHTDELVQYYQGLIEKGVQDELIHRQRISVLNQLK